MFAGTAIVGSIVSALSKGARVDVVSLEAGLFKHTESQLDPFLRQR